MIKLRALVFILIIVALSCKQQDINFTIRAVFPKALSNKTDTVTVSYIQWACACANWLPQQYNVDSIEDKSPYCIFIEAADPTLKVHDSIKYGWKGYQLQLIGNYYQEKGISRDYQQKTSQVPDPAKVFRYTNITIQSPSSINQESSDTAGTSKPITKTITIDKIKYQIVLNSHGDTIYMATRDPRLNTKEGYKVGTQWSEIDKKYQNKLQKEMGYAFTIRLDSKWQLAFCEGADCTSAALVDTSSVDWIFYKKQ